MIARETGFRHGRTEFNKYKAIEFCERKHASENVGGDIPNRETLLLILYIRRSAGVHFSLVKVIKVNSQESGICRLVDYGVRAHNVINIQQPFSFLLLFPPHY